MMDWLGNLESDLVEARDLHRKPARVPDEEPSLDEAYAIQRRLHARTQLPVMLWKLALTTPGARESKGAQEPVVGRLPASAICADRSDIGFVGQEMFAEAELVLELGADLPPLEVPYTRETVAPAIKGVYAGIEICRTRFAHSDLSLGLLVADNAMGHGLVLGSRLATAWDESFGDKPIVLVRNTAHVVTGATSRAHGHPLDALVWLANWACRSGEGGLSREQLIATGSCTGVTPISPGDTVTVTLDAATVARTTLSK